MLLAELKSHLHIVYPGCKWLYDDFYVQLIIQPISYENIKRANIRYIFIDKTFQLLPLFFGKDYSPSILYPPLSIESVLQLCSFLTMQVGDTDSSYFDNYTPRQLEWIGTNRCKDLSNLVSSVEF